MREAKRRKPRPNFQEYDEFLDATGQQQYLKAQGWIGAGNGVISDKSLLRVYSGSDQTRLISESEKRRSEYWDSIKGHKVLRDLESFPEFKDAWTSIEHGRVKAKGWIRPAHWKFNFSHSVAFHLSLYELQAQSGISTKYPDSKVRRKARDCAVQLLSLIRNEGVSLPIVFDQITLERNLTSLRREMESAKARPRNDKTLLERDTVMSFCESIRLHFGAISPAIARDFASMIGYDVDDIEPLIRRARTSYAGKLGNLLALASPPKPAK